MRRTASSATSSAVARGDYDAVDARLGRYRAALLAMEALINQQPKQMGRDAKIEPLSPELALVDPELAQRARARLAAVDADGSGATPPRERPDPAQDDRRPANSAHWMHSSVRERLLAAGADRERLLPTQHEDDRERPAISGQESRDGSRSRPWKLVIAAMTSAALAAAAATFMLLGQRSNDADAPGTDTSEPTQATKAGVAPNDTVRGQASSRKRPGPARRPNAPSTTPATKKRRNPSTPSTFATRTFVWPPASAAIFYRVEFFTHGRKVFEASPTKPRLSLPLRWTYRGRRFRLARGTYQWRVRPGFVRSPTRLGPPITRSTWVVR